METSDHSNLISKSKLITRARLVSTTWPLNMNDHQDFSTVRNDRILLSTIYHNQKCAGWSKWRIPRTRIRSQNSREQYRRLLVLKIALLGWPHLRHKKLILKACLYSSVFIRCTCFQSCVWLVILWRWGSSGESETKPWRSEWN